MSFAVYVPVPVGSIAGVGIDIECTPKIKVD